MVASARAGTRCCRPCCPRQSWDPDEPGLAPMFAPVAPGVYQPVAPAPPQYRFEPPPPPDVWHERAPITPRRRGHGGGIALVGGLGAVVLVAAAVVAVQLFGPTGDTQTAGPPPATATTEASDPTGGDTASPRRRHRRATPAPADVKLVDNGGSVTLTWADPSNGMVPFIVAGGRDGTPSAPVRTLDPRAHDDHDLRAQHRLQLLLHGRRGLVGRDDHVEPPDLYASVVHNAHTVGSPGTN